MKTTALLRRDISLCCGCRRLLPPSSIPRQYSLCTFSSDTSQTPKSAKHETSANDLSAVYRPPYNSHLRDLYGAPNDLAATKREYFHHYTNLHPFLISKLKELGYEKPLPVQHETLNATLKGKDVVIKSVTGSGKTLAFVLPMLNKIAQTAVQRAPQCIIVAPTRELCGQISSVIESFIGDERVINMAGGSVKVRKQGKKARAEKDILVATPGRVMQLVSMGIMKPVYLKFLVLDEADELLHELFYRNLRWILDHSNPTKQMIVTTATIPHGVQYIIDRYMIGHEYVDVSNEQLSLPERIKHKAVVFERGLFNRVIKWVLKTDHLTCSMVFVKYRQMCSPVAEYLRDLGYTVKYINSDMPQSARDKVMDGFKAGEFEILVTTDVSSRGVDVPQCELVVHIEPVTDVTKYIHRSGRTGRAGRPGTSILLLQREKREQMEFLEEISDHVQFGYFQYNKYQQSKMVRGGTT